MRKNIVLLALAAYARAAVMKRTGPQVDADGFTIAESLTPDDQEYGIMVSRGPNPIPRIVDLQPMQWPQYGSKRQKVRYGPYRIPDNMHGDYGLSMENEGGTIWNMGTKAPKPCEDCLGMLPSVEAKY
jgi:hypothetical protein